MLKEILTLISIVTIGSALLAQTSKPEVTQYTCVMHPEVVQDHPGKCPKCGMELVPVKKHKKHRTSNTEHPTPKSEAVNSPAHEPMHHHHEGHEQMMHEMKMQSSVNLADPMTREGSGTSWVPDTTPHEGIHGRFGDWSTMAHAQKPSSIRTCPR